MSAALAKVIGLVMRTVDPKAYHQAMKEHVVPPCLHVPIVAMDEQAISDHIGEIVEVLSPGRALLVRVDPAHPPDPRLPIFGHQNVSSLFPTLTLWVSPGYTRYRSAWRRAFGAEAIDGKVLHHIYNRRMARLRGFGFIRLTPISRATNSSSAFTEQWGVDLFTPEYLERRKQVGLRMQFADLGDLLTMLDVSLGGGVQEVFRLGQNLIEVPGVRPPQR